MNLKTNIQTLNNFFTATLFILMASAPFLASASEEVIYRHGKIEVSLPPNSNPTTILDQEIAMGPISSIDSITIDVNVGFDLDFAYDLDVKLIAPDGQTFHLIKNRDYTFYLYIKRGTYIFNGTAEQTVFESRKFFGSYAEMYPGTYRAESWPTGSWDAGNWRLRIYDSGYSQRYYGTEIDTPRRINSITVRGTLDRSNNETFFSNTYDKLVLNPSDSIEETFALGPVDYIDTLTLVGNHSRVRDLTFKLIAPDGQEFVAINKPDTDANLGYINHTLDEINYSYNFSVHGFYPVSLTSDLPDGQTTDYVVGTGERQFESWPTIPENGWDAGEWRILYVDDTAGEGGWLKSISLTGGLRPDPITPWQVWLNAHFGNSDAAQELADPDNDGRVNLAEYAFNLDPNDATDSHVHGLRIEAPQGAPALIYRKNKDASDVRYTLEQTADLASPNWQPAELEAENILREVGSTLEMRAATSNPVSNKYFYRLKIESE